MVTKAFVEEVIDKNHIRVRMPLYNKIKGVESSTPTRELPIAPICSLPNIDYNINVGDIVLIAFEEDKLGNPIIIGNLQTNIPTDSKINIRLNDLVADGEIKLSENTSIGNVKKEEIETLKGSKYNIQDKLDMIDTEINKAKNFKYLLYLINSGKIIPVKRSEWDSTQKDSNKYYLIYDDEDDDFVFD